MPKKRFSILSISLAFLLLMSSFVGIPRLKAYADTQTSTGPELLITEIMPKAEEGVDKYEFIELYNNSDNIIDLSDYSFIAPLNMKATEKTKILPKGILVICLKNDTSLSEFNNFYNSSLTADKYFTPTQPYSLGDASEQTIVIARDKDNDSVLDVICSAKYRPANFSEGKSITYKYPSSGSSMIITGQKQTPTPGTVDPYQIPNSGVYVTGINLDNDAVTINAGNSIVLLASVVPNTAVNKEVTWSSSNSSVATVNSSGVVTALRNGYANITAKTKDGGYTATCSVVVANIKVEDVSLNNTSKRINVGDTFNLVANVSPESATYKKLIWSSSNTDVATVTPSGSYTGVVKGKSEGEAKITVKTVDGGYTEECTVTVTDDDNFIDVTGVKLNREELEIEVGKEKVLDVDVLPYNASNDNVTWESDDIDVATVSSYGVVLAKAEGEAIITVKTDDGGYTDYCKVKVVESDNVDDDKIVNSIKLNKYLLVLTEGKNERLLATVKPENATNKSVSWKSDNTSVATVDVNGNVKAVSQGVAFITAKTNSGNHEAKCIVVVFDDGKSVISGIRLDKTSLRIMRGKTDKLTLIGIASNKNISKIEWKSDKPALVSVDKNGKITASKKYTGTATITVTVTAKGNGNKKETYSAKCTVLVTHDNGNKYHKKH